MKRVLILAILTLFFVKVFSQINQILPEKEDTKLKIVFQVLEESGEIIGENQIASLLDSLDQNEINNLAKKENIIKINQRGDTIYSIGDIAHGGIVFWIDERGRYGLVVSEEDLASEVFPYYEIEKYKGKTSALQGDSIYAGSYNTKQIIANKSVGYNAAQICINFGGGSYDDWYLPSKYELTLLYQLYRKGILPNFARDFYWSSSEDANDVAWLFRFYDGIVYNYPKYGSTAFRVRAIRAF